MYVHRIRFEVHPRVEINVHLYKLCLIIVMSVNVSITRRNDNYRIPQAAPATVIVPIKNAITSSPTSAKL